METTAAPSPTTSPPESAENIDLVERERILRDIFENQRDKLLGVLFSYVRSLGVANGLAARTVALDVYSELFIEAMRTAPKFDATRPGTAWLLGIGFNIVRRKKVERARDFQRTSQELHPADARLDEESADDAFDRVAALSRRYAEQSSALETRAAVEAMLALVSPGDREVLRLAVIHGLKGESVAQALNIQPAAARQRLHRAIERLSAAYHHLQNEDNS